MSVVLYLDTSALVKHYVWEPGSEEVDRILADAQWAGASLLARVELEAAFAKYVRMALLPESEARSLLVGFRMDWERLTHLHPDPWMTDLASELVWRYGLRGYDAVHLASALRWQDAALHPVTFATFDRKLWRAAADAGLHPFPDDLTPFLAP